MARPGLPLASLLDEAINQKADLLVMGVMGHKPVEACQLGSLATELIPHTSVPMLLVPPGACYRSLQTIVLAVDLSTSVNALALSGAKQFAQLVRVTLEVICKEDEPDARLRKAAERVHILLSNQPHTVKFLPGNDLAMVLDDYLSEHKADLCFCLSRLVGSARCCSNPSRRK